MVCTPAPDPRPRTALTAILAGLLVGLPGCVTESGAKRPPIVTTKRDPSAPLEINGPVARPAAGQSATTRLRVLLQPLATLAFDGQTLPLTSPDGRLLVLQRGEAPTWPTVLALPGASPATGAALALYDLTSSPVAEVNFATPPEPGLMLGRSADSAGFLVERHNPDGSRWIGKVSWTGRTLTWLVRDGNVNAHGVLSPAGDLVYSRRAPSTPLSELVVLTRDSRTQVVTEPATSLVFPSFGGDGQELFAFGLAQSGTEVLAWGLPTGGPRPVGPLRARRQIAGNADAALAYQAVAASQTPTPGASPEAQGFVFFHPTLRRMTRFLAAQASLDLLPADSVAAVRVPALATGGYLCTTARGLIFSPDPPAGGTRTIEARLLDVPHIARATTQPDRPAVLVGPVPKASAPTISVMRLLPEPDEAAKP
ncbi:MAG: hypothetical protein HRU70_09485 [Phycisphaeraceae bacterium]|nr:MAG: hypothetical protein HRU70_09485 [Phycisphaeraceae bacterium]